MGGGRWRWCQFFVLRPLDAEAAAAAAAQGAHVGVRVRRSQLTLAAMETLLQVRGGSRVPVSM